MLASIELEKVDDPRLREQLEVARAMHGLDLTPPWQDNGGTSLSSPS